MSEFKVNILDTLNYGRFEDKANRAGKLFEAVFNTEEFKNEILNFKYNKIESFADNLGLTNQQVYEMLMDGEEISNPAEDHKADFILRSYSKWWPLGPTIGFTDVHEGIIYTKWDFIKHSTEAELAGHYAHEYCHCLGFTHDYEDTESRPFSVPYVVGDIVSRIATQY